MEKGSVIVNERQKKFAEYYAQSGNTVQSAIKAGYTSDYANKLAYKLLENIGVKEYIQKLTAKETKKRVMTAEERRALLTEFANDPNAKLQDRLKAMDILNKMTGEYITKIEGSISAEVSNPYKDLTTEELRNLAK